MDQPKWSPSEKSIARRIYDGALHRELDAITQEVQDRANSIKTPSDVWALEGYLTESRKRIDGKYEYKYSVLPLLFAQLLREGNIALEDLDGLGEDKLAYVRALGSFAGKGPTS
jgi:hypothetical protein